MNNYTKVFSSLIHSSVWREDDKTRILWITLLVMADSKGEVFGADIGLADAAKISDEDYGHAIEVLSGPDPRSKSQEFEGRRIERIEGGFRILNYSKYLLLMSRDDIREKGRVRAKRFREKHFTGDLFESNNDTETETDTETGKNITSDFDEFWKHAVRKDAKGQSRKAFKSAVKKLPFSELLKKWKAYNESKAMTERRFILLPSTWLNGERWNDILPHEPTEPKDEPIDYDQAPETKEPKFLRRKK